MKLRLRFFFFRASSSNDIRSNCAMNPTNCVSTSFRLRGLSSRFGSGHISTPEYQQGGIDPLRAGVGGDFQVWPTQCHGYKDWRTCTVVRSVMYNPKEAFPMATRAFHFCRWIRLERSSECIIGDSQTALHVSLVICIALGFLAHNDKANTAHRIPSVRS